MAQSLSAKKRIRQNEKARLRNRMRRSALKTEIRKFLAFIHDRDASAAAEQLKKVYKELDQVAAKGTIHRNTAARRKARLAKRLADLQAHAGAAA